MASKYVGLLSLLLCTAVIALMASSIEATAQTPPEAKTVLDAAVKRAQTEDKNVFVRFGASWCSWCKRLDALVTGPQFGKQFDENYVLIYLTIQESDDKKGLENPGAQQMVDAIGGEKSGVPVFIFFDKTGNTLATSLAMANGSNIGHPVTPEEIAAFDGLLQRTAPRMTPAQRQEIADHLAKQK